MFFFNQLGTKLVDSFGSALGLVKPTRLICLSAACLALIWSQAPAFADSVSRIKASYRLSAPVGSGKFYFMSRFNGNHYSLNGSAHFKAIFGFFDWRSNMTSAGRMVSAKPRPSKYHFKAASKKKKENVAVRFSGSRVSQIKAYPPLKKGRNRVPLTKRHLRNVIDPLSAVFVFQDDHPSLTNGRQACNRSLEMFDGRQRFRLTMSYKRKTKVNLKGKGRSTVFVCRIKYRPIAGYRPKNKAINHVSKSNQIEMWLLPLPKGKMYIPYRISVPIILGTAHAELSHFTVMDSKAGKIALRR